MSLTPHQVKIISWTAAGTGLLLVLFLLFRVDPSRGTIFPVCAFHRMTGLNCPGCGGLRATHHLLHGRIATAFHHNMIVVIAPPLLALVALRWYLQKRRDPVNPVKIWRLTPWLVVIGFLVLFSILRNIPHPLFAWMSPRAPSSVVHPSAVP